MKRQYIKPVALTTEIAPAAFIAASLPIVSGDDGTPAQGDTDNLSKDWGWRETSSTDLWADEEE